MDDGVCGDWQCSGDTKQHACFDQGDALRVLRNKVTKKLQAVPNVKSASVDPEKGSAVVVTADGKELSPKAVWEAVEGAGYQPTELKGPAGTFKTKPTK